MEGEKLTEKKNRTYSQIGKIVEDSFDDRSSGGSRLGMGGRGGPHGVEPPRARLPAFEIDLGKEFFADREGWRVGEQGGGARHGDGGDGFDRSNIMLRHGKRDLEESSEKEMDARPEDDAEDCRGGDNDGGRWEVARRGGGGSGGFIGWKREAG